jgi:2-(1,2-epoxy-1,2-dihydrophenyl)acetyl-CoA isomerase
VTRIKTDLDRDVLVVTLDRPDRLNALSPVMVQELEAAWERAAEPEVRAMVITGAGRGFCAGADIEPQPDEVAVAPRMLLRRCYNPMLLRLDSLGKPLVAAVNGPAAGAGLGLACAADVRIASTAASFVPAFAQLGVVPDMGTSYFLPRILGYERALVWTLDGERWTAARAREEGLVRAVVEHDRLVDDAVALARRLIGSTPSAVRATRALLRDAMGSSLAAHLDSEDRLQAMALADPERARLRASTMSRVGHRRQDPGGSD